MKRIFPRSIYNKFQLSYILEQYLAALGESPLQVGLTALAYDTRIPMPVFQRLLNLQLEPADAPNIQVEDFHILFSNLMFRYPTVKIWEQVDGKIFIEM